jgi:hypothetical protein
VGGWTDAGGRVSASAGSDIARTKSAKGAGSVTLELVDDVRPAVALLENYLTGTIEILSTGHVPAGDNGVYCSPPFATRSTSTPGARWSPTGT